MAMRIYESILRTDIFVAMEILCRNTVVHIPFSITLFRGKIEATDNENSKIEILHNKNGCLNVSPYYSTCSYFTSITKSKLDLERKKGNVISGCPVHMR